HVAADPAALPGEWTGRFDLVLALDAELAPDQVAPAGLQFIISATKATVPEEFAEVLAEQVEDPEQPGVERWRAVLVRLGRTTEPSRAENGAPHGGVRSWCARSGEQATARCRRR
ncbi:MAG: hypothetical protein WBQ48_09655, partial [Aeromicrobium sp.]